ncbi:MAG: hypothetical protein NT107_13685 [Planctomycetota bacterium]|nr:hypothetical protein [Planctomycetota bacterium]
MRKTSLLALALSLPPLTAQWAPTAGQWGKSQPSDLRVMTYNVRDTLCSTNTKNSATNNWAALARIVALLQPDVLILQECGDNSGNGSGNNADTVAQLTTTIGMWLHGGTDTFRNNATITSYVQAFAPGYDLPQIFVSTISDGFNRNVILSRFPFLDLNGDGRATMSDIPTITADLWSIGGNGGIRGFMTAEIDLPNATYAGNIVVGNSHLKSGGTTSDHTQRVTAAQNIAYYTQYFWNGAGGTVADPRGRIADSPAASLVLDNNTSFVTGGDWNEDPNGNGGVPGPVEWITRAQVADSANGTDGPDRNGTDMTYGDARDPFTGSEVTYPNGSFHDDFIAAQDSIASVRRAFLFASNTITPATAMPTSLLGFAPGAALASGTCSDHLPVILDFILPAPIACNAAGTDLGFAKLASNNRYPRFGACGSLANGGHGALQLADCPPNSFVFAGLSGSRSILNLYGATIVPAAPALIGPFLLDANGTFSLPVPGGGAALYMQWALLDPAASFGLGFSNALRLNFTP